MQSLSQSPYTLDEYSYLLQAESLGIKLIDKINPAISKKIVKISLSRNCIHKLDNLQQFTNLCELDVSHNRIRNGKQLLKLNTMKKLTRVKIEGNPFLNDPLDEQVLQFILERETDIEILSGDHLIKIKELEEGQLKVVFLENYLKKLNYHDELMSRSSGYNSKEKEPNNEVINKIMPQFYNSIEDSRIKTQIKKQTIHLKKHNQLSFEEALTVRKRKQQAQVEKLVNDILQLLDEQHLDEQKIIKEKQNQSFEKNSQNFYSFHEKQRKETKKLEQTQREISTRHEQYENSYYMNLTKYNSAFALLYSDISSLGDEEKNMLLEELFKDHKQKTIELFKQWETKRQLKQEIEDKMKSHKSEKKELLRKIQELQSITTSKEKYLMKSQRQNVRLNDLLNSMSGQVDRMKQQNTQLREESTILIEEMNRLSLNYEKVYKEKMKYSNGQEIQEQIKQLRQKRIKEKFLQLVMKRGHQYAEVDRRKKQHQKRQEKRIVSETWTKLKKHMIRQIMVKMKEEQINEKIQKKYFFLLKQHWKKQKIIAQKEEKVKKSILRSAVKDIILVQKEKKKILHEKNLKNYWANNHFMKVTMYKLLKRTKQKQKLLVELEAQWNQQKKEKLKKKYFSSLLMNKNTMKNKEKTLQKQIELKKLSEAMKTMRRFKEIRQLSKQKSEYMMKFSEVFQNWLTIKRSRELFLNNAVKKPLMREKQAQVIRLKKSLNLKRFMKNMYEIRKIKQKYENFVKLERIKKRKALLQCKTSHTLFKIKAFTILSKIINKKRKKQRKIQKRQKMLENKRKNEKKIRFLKNLFKNCYLNRAKKAQFQKSGTINQAKNIIESIKAAENEKLGLLIQQREKDKVNLRQQIIKIQLQYSNDKKTLEVDRLNHLERIEILEETVSSLNEKQRIWLEDKYMLLEEITEKDQKNKQREIELQLMREENERYKIKYNELFKKYNENVEEGEKRRRRYIYEMKTPEKSTTLKKGKKCEYYTQRDP